VKEINIVTIETKASPGRTIILSRVKSSPRILIEKIEQRDKRDGMSIKMIIRIGKGPVRGIPVIDMEGGGDPRNLDTLLMKTVNW
jgi:hypothetical protein